jgi:protein involved in polysaccharide export with SLBB domain
MNLTGIWKSAVLSALGLGMAVLASCSTAGAEAPPASSPPAVEAATDALDAAEGYRLDTGDQIKVTVFGEPNLSGTFQVDGTGLISMSLIGEVSAKNKTVRQLQRDIETRLKDGYLRDPQVSAEVMTFRPFYILGEVNRPGEYPYTDGLTVMNAIASAGDFTYRADKRKIVIKSVDSDRERTVDLTPTTQVRPGDTIRVKERFF